MKKYVLSIIIYFMFIIPINVSAASISKLQVSGFDSVKVGDTFTQSFYVGVSGIQKGQSGLGIGGVVFEVDFDDSILSLTNISKIDSFESQLYKEDGKYYIISTIDETNSFKNKCVDEVLYCADYLITLSFYVKDTYKESTKISIPEAEVVLFETDSEYEEDEAITISSTIPNGNTITIKKAEGEINSAPSSVVASSESKNIISKTESNASNLKEKNNNNNSSKSYDKPTTKTKNTNNYLNKLEIKNYDIKFNKEKTSYKVYIQKNINKVEIIAEPESDLSKIEIKGADNLKENDYKVNVIVTSESETKNTYTINFILDEEETTNTKKEFNYKNFFKKHKTIIIIVSSIIGLLILIIMIMFGIRNRKENKKFKNFDNF